MNCDRIATLYQWIEAAAFGGRLQKHRLRFLDAAVGKTHALVVGDGDGRFAHELSHRFPDLKIDSLELSTGMLFQARKRLQFRENIQLIQGDAVTYPLPQERYEVVFTHFLLDCFDSSHLDLLLKHLSDSITVEAEWVVSEFKHAPSGWRRFYTGTWLWVMYFFFHHATGLTTRRLPEYASRMKALGFSLNHEWVSFDGLISSQWWQR